MKGKQNKILLNFEFEILTWRGNTGLYWPSLFYDKTADGHEMCLQLGLVEWMDEVRVGCSTTRHMKCHKCALGVFDFSKKQTYTDNMKSVVSMLGRTVCLI
jgi:hypothetical protein